MAKRLIDIKNEITEKEKEFIPYLKNLLCKEVFSFIIELDKIAKVYLFSGIIRDYFIGKNEVRDVDIMIDSSEDISHLIKRYEHRKNSFGGYKVFIENTTVDLWYLKDTWALHHSQKVLEFELERYIPSTAFFNFSSIIFSFNDSTFIYTQSFLQFLRDRRIDYVFKPNANYALCVINSFYYQDKLKLPLTDKLKKHILTLHKRHSDYEEVQVKHFGKVLYKNSDIDVRIKQIEYYKSK